MRKAVISLVLMSVSICALAQTHRQLDSLQYILPHFGQGTVMFADKHFSQGLVNISPMDQVVYCISAAGDTLSVADDANIVSLSVAGRSFIKWRDFFVEAAITNGDTGIGIIRSTAMVDNVKTGAYGMTNSTSAIRSYSYDTSAGLLQRKILDDPRNYVYKEYPCLYKAGKYYDVTKKSFVKLFPDQKAFIESVWSERKLNLADVDDVIDFYNEILQNINL